MARTKKTTAVKPDTASQGDPRDPSRDPRPREYSIDELAQAAGATVRNVRAYQDRGILPPPERRGRKGIYTDVHFQLLKVIGQLLDRGYTINNIGELLNAVEKGHDISQLLGLEAAIAGPWTNDLPGYFTISELAKMFKIKVTLKNLGALDTAIKLGLLEREGTRFRSNSPKLLHIASELVELGIPLEDMLEILRMMRGNVQRVADELVQRVVPVFDRYGDALPPPEDVPDLVNIIQRLRPLAEAAMNIEAMMAVEKAANKFLGDRIAHVIDSLES